MDDILVIDYETGVINEDGSITASTDAYYENFRVLSCAASWFEGDEIKSIFLQGESAVREYLKTIPSDKKLVAHNLQFEVMVTLCRFPELTNLNWYADTMRLVQNYDNGGQNEFITIITEDDQLDGLDDDEEPGPDAEVKRVSITGLGLSKSLKRIMNVEDHKKEAYDWLKANGVKKGKEGESLHLLPDDILERYNIGDTENTLRLYQFLVEYFAVMEFDWTFDHRLFVSTLNKVVRATIVGVPVDRESLKVYIDKVAAEIKTITDDFTSRLTEPIKKVERARKLAEVRKRKTMRGRKNYLKRLKAKPEVYEKDVKFNVGSNKQLADLFVGVLKMQAKFVTEKGNPSFKSSALGQWGESGELLKTRRKRMLVLKQSESLYNLSAKDGVWHCTLKIASTKTGRMAGGQH